MIRLRSLPTGAWMVDPNLKAKLIEDARQERSSMTAVALRILSKTYGVEYEPTGRIGRGRGDTDVLNLSLPDHLDQVMGMNAAAHHRSLQDEVRVALSAHYGLSMPSRARAAA